MHIFYENHGCPTIFQNQTCISDYVLSQWTSIEGARPDILLHSFQNGDYLNHTLHYQNIYTQSQTFQAVRQY